MTSKSPNKASARSLASLTGVPYQKCLTAVEVLRQIPQGFALGDLDVVMGGNGSRHAVLHLPEDGSFCQALVTAEYGPLHDDAEVVVIAGEHPVLLSRLDGGHWGALPADASLWVDLDVGDERLRPAGIWQVSVAALRRGVENASNGSITVVAEEAPAADSFPTSFTGGDAAYLSPQLSVGRPSYVTTGPGFDWAHMLFADLGMVSDADEGDHRLVDCDRFDCDWLHDWPTADPTHTQMTIPVPLLDAYQRLWSARHFNDDDFDNESYFLYNVAENGCAWYGLDLPDLTRIWMRVDRDSVAPTGIDEHHRAPFL